jgi:transcriptional regulator with XRE-family HTH domain
MARRLDPAAASLLGATIKAARLERSLSLQRLAHECGMHHSQLSRLERGQFTRLSGNVQVACSKLHIPANEVMASDPSVAQLHARIDALVTREPRTLEVLAALLDALDAMQGASA